MRFSGFHWADWNPQLPYSQPPDQSHTVPSPAMAGGKWQCPMGPRETSFHIFFTYIIWRHFCLLLFISDRDSVFWEDRKFGGREKDGMTCSKEPRPAYMVRALVRWATWAPPLQAFEWRDMIASGCTFYLDKLETSLLQNSGQNWYSGGKH